MSRGKSGALSPDHPYLSLRRQMEEITGLPCPTQESHEQWAAYEVASAFLLHARFEPNPEIAARAAVGSLLAESAWPFEMLRPHIERGLGRGILAEEISAGVLVD
jgi:hypothetical protein